MKVVSASVDSVLRQPPGPRILIYHRIGPALGRQTGVSPLRFGQHIDWLREKREIVDLETAMARRGDVTSGRLVVLTFDDGFVDTFTVAFPLLKRHGLPFVIYVSTESIESGNPLRGEEGSSPLSWAQLEEMLGSGLMTVGAHTHTHPDLRSLNATEVAMELNTSDDLIRSQLGVAPLHFAYPYGFWSPQADGPVRERYDTAVVGASPRYRSISDPHILHRYPIQGSDGFLFFRARVRGGLRAEEVLRRRIRRYSGP